MTTPDLGNHAHGSAVQERFFGHCGPLFAELAAHIAALLQAALAARGRATLIVPGGRSAPALFVALREHDLAWANVTITLSDERWVSRDHAESNEALVRQHLLQGKVKDAAFFALHSPALSLDQAPAHLSQVSEALRLWPADVAVLGMGEDGHTASIFPSSPAHELEAALQPTSGVHYAAAHPRTSPVPRITVAMPTLRASRNLALLIPGSAKLQVYLAALQPGPTTALPVRGILAARAAPATPVEIWWSP